MLMLSLIKSILVVKLLHHSEKEVKQMSLSACLLDRYGSAGHGFAESTFTSIKTLEHLNSSEGTPHHPIQRHLVRDIYFKWSKTVDLLLTDYEHEYSLDDDLLSLNEVQDTPTGLEWLLRELVSLRMDFSQEESDSSAQAEWLSLCLRLDCLLFRLYLFVLSLYAGTLVLLWASWSFAWHV